MRIKNWARFQHFRDRKPPWIKLYRELLDDMEWSEIDPGAAKLLIALWLLASENDGELPTPKAIAFRVRQSEKHVNTCLALLSHWVERDDITAISERHQHDALETETETERETEKDMSGKPDYDVPFLEVWNLYPDKIGKQDAQKAYRKWVKAGDTHEEIMTGLRMYIAHVKSRQRTDFPDLKYKNAKTWFNARGWKDFAATADAVPVPHNLTPGLYDPEDRLGQNEFWAGAT